MSKGDKHGIKGAIPSATAKPPIYELVNHGLKRGLKGNLNLNKDSTILQANWSRLTKVNHRLNPRKNKVAKMFDTLRSKEQGS